jgi:hypothetical protein
MVQCLEFLHVTSNWTGMVGAEYMAMKGSRHDDEGKGLAAVAHGLHGDELPMEHAHSVVAEEQAVVAADIIERGVGPWSLCGEAVNDEVGIVPLA